MVVGSGPAVCIFKYSGSETSPKKQPDLNPNHIPSIGGWFSECEDKVQTTLKSLIKNKTKNTCNVKKIGLGLEQVRTNLRFFSLSLSFIILVFRTMSQQLN